jgi:hypothetical protein
MKRVGMSKTIYLRVGDSDRIGLRDFVVSLKGFLRLLRDFDSTVSGKEYGTQRWDVTSVSKNSPIVVGVTPVTKPRMVDLSDVIETELLESSNALTSRKERTERMSDSALIGIGQLARVSKRLGPSAIYIAANGRPKQESLITAATMQAVNELTGVQYQAFGTISGRLEAITVHGRSEFRVWDDATGKVVRCKYPTDLEHKILRLLRSAVYVTGMISSNIAGYPISVVVDELAEKLPLSAPANIRQMAGFIKDYTGGRRLKDYLKETADE